MATEQVVHYRDVSAEYLSHARTLLAEGNLKQASEKAWGATAHLDLAQLQPLDAGLGN